MSDAVAVAIVAGLAPTLMALASLIVSIRNGKKADRIEISVDGNLSELRDDLAATRTELGLSQERRITDAQRSTLNELKDDPNEKTT